MMKKYRLIDLTMPLGPITPQHNVRVLASHWHGPTTGPTATLVASAGEPTCVGWHLSFILMGSHASTHVDAPYHKHAEGLKLYELPLEKFAGEAICLDVSPKGERELITAEDLEDAEERAEAEIQEGDIVLIRAGWSDRYMRGEIDAEKYKSQTPAPGADAARWLLKKKVKTVGSDVYSMDLEPTPEFGWRWYLDPKNFPTHELLLKEGIPLIENLVNLETISGKKVFFVAFPLKFQNLPDACPVRAVAFVEE